MSTETNAASGNKAITYGGYVMSAIPVFMLCMSAYMKLSKNVQAVDGFKQMGYPDAALLSLGAVELACTILYVIPQTSVLGAILLTGYLGGATDVHARMGDLPGIATAVGLGILVWGGIFLRDARVRVLIPFRR